ncbi:MAG: glycosyltransferase [Actinomycetota bacterium]|nr:glycosyltransferase [Actinomycetota bacterium]
MTKLSYIFSINFFVVLFTGAVSDPDLATLLRYSHCLLLTSDHEGFGIPPLEAMEDLVPVIAKGVGAVPDTVGGGGIVLPGDAGPCLFAEAVARLLSDKNLRNDLVLAGLEHVDSFDAADRSFDVVELLQDAFR